MVFGAVAIQDSVIQSWLGDKGAPHYPFGIEIFSRELRRRQAETP